MKTLLPTALAITLTLAATADEKTKPPTEADKAQALAKHQEGSDVVSIDQDKQAANAQELIVEQTDPKVIELLTMVETLMAQTTDRLEDANTDGDTIAMQTEIIEKIYEAAKAKSQSPSEGASPGSQESMGAMLEMMGQMMGKEGENQDKESEKGGEGSTGESDAANTQNGGSAKGQKATERRVPRAAGKSGTTLPPEFQKALDGYNKAAAKK